MTAGGGGGVPAMLSVRGMNCCTPGAAACWNTGCRALGAGGEADPNGEETGTGCAGTGNGMGLGAGCANFSAV